MTTRTGRQPIDARVTADVVTSAKNHREQREAEGSEITLSTGIILRAKKVPGWLIADILNEFNRKKPRPPKVFIEAKGREEENPEHPGYLEDLKAWEDETALALNDAVVVEGTEAIEVPEGLPTHTDETWLRRMQAMGRPVDNEFLAYLTWVKYVATGDLERDTQLILQEVGRLSGIREQDVQAAAGRFRSTRRGPTDLGGRGGRTGLD